MYQEENKLKKKSIIEAKFLRNRREAKYTLLWSEMASIEQEEVLSLIKLQPDESVILGYKEGKSYWWILTNLKLILKNGKSLDYFDLDNIEKVEVNQVFENETSKKEVSRLELKTKNEEVVELKVELGLWTTLYDLFLFIVKK
ncbi:hypothetical protein [Chitinophaga deserti]|uniref:hypothetical protein n=1 Tax=Chitinophaga deserti TaxID=2164099 RepID=UPI000D6D8A81|nr:hypothetical protein [Chitinophaga deserti]